MQKYINIIKQKITGSIPGRSRIRMPLIFVLLCSCLILSLPEKGISTETVSIKKKPRSSTEELLTGSWERPLSHISFLENKRFIEYYRNRAARNINYAEGKWHYNKRKKKITLRYGTRHSHSRNPVVPLTIKRITPLLMQCFFGKSAYRSRTYVKIKDRHISAPAGTVLRSRPGSATQELLTIPLNGPVYFLGEEVTTTEIKKERIKLDIPEKTDETAKKSNTADKKTGKKNADNKDKTAKTDKKNNTADKKTDPKKTEESAPKKITFKTIEIATKKDWVYVQWNDLKGWILKKDLSKRGSPVHDSLRYTIAAGDRKKLRTLLRTDAGPDEKIAVPFRKSPVPLLIWATENRQFDIIELLLKKGARINRRTSEGETALFISAGKNIPTRITRLLLEHKADTSIGNSEQTTPLIAAAMSGNEKKIRLLVEQGANVNSRDREGRIPLEFLLKRSTDLELLKLLLKKGANPLIPGSGNKPILTAMALKKNAPLTRLLKDYGADSSAQESSKKEHPLFQAIKNNRISTVNILTKMEPGINTIQDHKGWSVLHHAVRYDRKKMVSLLLERGSDISLRDKKGWTPLHTAAFRNSLSSARLLLQKGAAVNARDIYGRTPLHETATGAFARLLISKGARVDVSDKQGNTPLHAAAIRDLNSMAAALLTGRASVNRQNSSGFTPANNAAYYNSINVLKLLMAHNADMYIPDTYNRMTPLHWAIAKQYTESIDILIEHGYFHRANYRPTGVIILKRILVKGDFKLADRLLKSGADINEKDESGRTLLEIFKPGGGSNGISHTVQGDILKFLIEHGAEERPRSAIKALEQAPMERDVQERIYEEKAMEEQIIDNNEAEKQDSEKNDVYYDNKEYSPPYNDPGDFDYEDDPEDF
ncbi:MAG: hypothetical protein GY754_02180 [bacterium]|nr:hypothetical protein [bacterium]